MNEKRENMVNVLNQNEEFIIIGLTGRIGSGCSQAADVFGLSFKELELPWIQPGSNGLPDNKERDRRILQRFASFHWLKFDIIRTRTIISLFVLKNIDSFVKQIEEKTNKDTIKKDIFKSINEALKSKKHKKSLNEIEQELNKLIGANKHEKENAQTNENNTDNENETNNTDSDTREGTGTETETETKTETDAITLSSLDKSISLEKQLFEKIGKLYSDEKLNLFIDKSRYYQQIEELLDQVVDIATTSLMENISNSDSLFVSLKQISENLNSKEFRFLSFIFVYRLMPLFSNAIRETIKNNNLSFTKLFQKYGNSIRKYGSIVYNDENDSLPDDTDKTNNNEGIFSIPIKMVDFIMVLRHPFESECVRPVRIVIDSIKNVFEAKYLRQRYSSFYLFAISSDDEIRKKRLMNDKNITMEDIDIIDWNEYSNQGYEIYHKQDNDITLTKNEIKFRNQIISNDDMLLYDKVRHDAYKEGLQQFYLQDVAASIENADVFISNNPTDSNPKNMDLRWEIVRNVSLIMFPGLLMPTPIERCMQVAFAAKVNSGCLSRQVGAVVADKNFNILSIGWNDIPCGDISCARKNLADLCKWEDKPAYTNYELEDKDFRNRIINIRNHNHKQLNLTLRGIPFWYCFKDIHTNSKNPMRSRAMHAEEKALARCGKNCEEGYLFTTSSPCEMCSKNAKDHKIKQIYYIELYPGISESQYSRSGDPNNIAKHKLFTGAIGRAYMQMYTPIMPQKDILKLLGIEYKSDNQF